MSRYENFDETNPMAQKDIVLASNEYAFVLSKTSGIVKVHSGPMVVTTSQQESLVNFDERTKRFVEITNPKNAKQLFTSAPEGWYVVLKNPAIDNDHPELGKPTQSPELRIGEKINISGPCSFPLFPGQMAKVIQGHRLRSNQYLLARVYDAEAAEKNMSDAIIVSTEVEKNTNEQNKTNKTEKTENKKSSRYHVGQLLVIKGTEVSFYMPPTGIEVLAMENKNEKNNSYIRDAVTLERLEYAILKDEDGEKRYIHGPAVVFPEPTETFVETPRHTNIFRALELSPISGIYIKVIAGYDEKLEDGIVKHHPVGEELFITGNQQMIYYPRPEHAMIQYDGKYMHHAIAIPRGEGRYILNRLTGEAKTVKGPVMYLPDPRTEVVTKRKLTQHECKMYYPENREVLEYNLSLNEKAIEKLSRGGNTDPLSDVINCAYMTSNQESTLAIFEANSKISRGVSYTKPRTIVLDTKFDGVVSIDVWSGYAISVVNKEGKRETVVGPITRLLDYDEYLETIYTLEKGCEKEVAFLKIKDNSTPLSIYSTTKDNVRVNFMITCNYQFIEKEKNSWFTIKHPEVVLGDTVKSLMSAEINKYTAKELYNNGEGVAQKIFKDLFEKLTPALSNGITITGMRFSGVELDGKVKNMLKEKNLEIIKQNLSLEKEKELYDVEAQIDNYGRMIEQMKTERNKHILALQKEQQLMDIEKQESIRTKQAENEKKAKEEQRALQSILDEINEAELKRLKAVDDAKIETEKQLVEIEQKKHENYANAVAEIMQSITPGLVEALNANANADMLEAVSKGIAPYAIAKNESAADFVNKLLRGTTLESIVEGMHTVKTIETEEE